MELLFREESRLADGRKCRGYGYYDEITFISHGCGIKYFSAYNSYDKFWIDQVDCPIIVSTKITKEDQLIQNYPPNLIGGCNSINRCYTVCLRIIAVFKSKGMQILLAAPTGRAAKRMTEATGMEAKTIHRLPEYNPMEGCKRNDENPLEGDTSTSA